jgi:hypothetical protein
MPTGNADPLRHCREPPAMQIAWILAPHELLAIFPHG